MIEVNAGNTNENEASARNLVDTVYLDQKQLINVDYSMDYPSVSKKDDKVLVKDAQYKVGKVLDTDNKNTLNHVLPIPNVYDGEGGIETQR